ncbi:hypothetical protein C1H76_3943 [Elsinoe australis]|uniref:Uncharacterized protein n=1 Tax=Elsinoe australis TaxID=40998 RepID=A0A4U7B2U4_9PEZI|nr:hypothetical protein C1H76_3943 [Elsinoe australis]
MPSRTHSARASPRPETERVDSGFASVSLTPQKPSTSAASSRRAGKRSAVHTPVLQSIDTTPASIEAHQRREEMAAAQIPKRAFVQNFPEGDIFGIRIPPQAAQPTRTENHRFRTRSNLSGGRASNNNDSSELQGDQENDTEMEAPVPEPSKTPAWIRTGPARPLGEMRIDPRASLNLDDSMDLDSSFNLGPHTDHDPFNSQSNIASNRNNGEGSSSSSLDGSGGGQRKISREYPPSPKKSPVKRLLFKAPTSRGLDLDSTYSSMHNSYDEKEQEDEEDGETSFLGSMATNFMHRRSRQPKAPTPAPVQAEEMEQPTEMPHFERTERPVRPRRSLMRRRRTTIHEDPITSPKLDAGTRVNKPEPKRVGSGSSLSSVEEAAAVAEVESLGTEADSAKGAQGMLKKERSLREVEETPRRAEQKRVQTMEEKMWDACGRDVRRWNRGDFSSGTVGGLAKGLEVVCRW